MPHPNTKPLRHAPKRGIATRVLEANPHATEEAAQRVSRNIHRRLREQAQKARS